MFGAPRPFGVPRPFGSPWLVVPTPPITPIQAVVDPFLAVLIPPSPSDSGAQVDPLAVVLIQ